MYFLFLFLASSLSLGESFSAQDTDVSLILKKSGYTSKLPRNLLGVAHGLGEDIDDENKENEENRNGNTGFLSQSVYVKPKIVISSDHDSSEINAFDSKTFPPTKRSCGITNEHRRKKYPRTHGQPPKKMLDFSNDETKDNLDFLGDEKELQKDECLTNKVITDADDLPFSSSLCTSTLSDSPFEGTFDQKLISERDARLSSQSFSTQEIEDDLSVFLCESSVLTDHNLPRPDVRSFDEADSDNHFASPRQTQTPQKISTLQMTVKDSPTTLGVITPLRWQEFKKFGLRSPEIRRIEALNRYSRDTSRLHNEEGERKSVKKIIFDEDSNGIAGTSSNEYEEQSDNRSYLSVEDELRSTLSEEELDILLPFLEEYKSCQPKPVVSLPRSLRRMIDQDVLFILGYSRRDIAYFVERGFVGYYPRDVYYLPSKCLSDGQRRQERRNLEGIMRDINRKIPSSLGSLVDHYALEDKVISPFEAWIKHHKSNGTQFSLDFKTINLMVYKCLKDALNKDLYRIAFLPNGYIIVYSPLMKKGWVNPYGESSESLTKRKKSPVDLDGRTVESHHVAGDILTDPTYYEEMIHFLSTKENYTSLSLKKLFETACILWILSKGAHDRDIHPYPYNPDRRKFTKVREEGNIIMYDNHFSK